MKAILKPSPSSLLSYAVLHRQFYIVQADPAGAPSPYTQLAVDIAGDDTLHLPLDDKGDYAP